MAATGSSSPGVEQRTFHMSVFSVVATLPPHGGPWNEKAVCLGQGLNEIYTLQIALGGLQAKEGG